MGLCTSNWPQPRFASYVAVMIVAGAAMVFGMTVAPDTMLPEAHAQFQSGGVDRDGSWYLGEGLEQGDYFSYSMCHTSYKECTKFRMNIWVSGDTVTGSETKWLIETVVYDGNRILKGDIEAGKVVPEPTGGTKEILKYRNAFKSSVGWLSAFATPDSIEGPGKGPKEFRDVSWGKIANIGGEQVKPESIEEVRAAGEMWDAVQIGWRTGGASSKIWVVDEFPFPVKAKTYVHVSEGIPPVEYEFTLLDYAKGVTESPFANIIPTPEETAQQECETNVDKNTVIKKATAGAMYQVHVAYGPEDPKQGCDMEWLISFIDKYDETEFLNQVQFDVITLNDDGSPNRSLADENGRPFLYSPSGQYPINIPALEDPGTVNYVIIVYGLAHENELVADNWDIVKIPITIYEGAAAVDNPQQIPSWIKTNAGWWAEGEIDDNSFVQAIQYLIKHGVIQIPSAGDGGAAGADAPTGIPSWIKTNAGWWAEGEIDDNSFVQAIQYLIKHGIIVI